MAATEHLVITYAGWNARTTRAVPLAVPVGEPRTRCPRSQASLPANGGAPPTATVRPGELPVRRVGAGPSVQPRRHGAGPRSRRGTGRRPAPPLFTGTLAADPVAEVAMSDPTALPDPCELFLRQRLGLSRNGTSPPPPIRSPLFKLHGLQRWQVGDRVLTGCCAMATTPGSPGPSLSGPSPACRLPRGSSVSAIGGPRPTHRRPGVALRTEPCSPPPPCHLGCGSPCFVPFVSGNRRSAGPLNSSLKDKDILGLWVRTLAWQASQPGSPIVSSACSQGIIWRQQLDLPGPPRPTPLSASLDLLVGLLARGRREPLPLMP